jgi:hypothetical protein
LQVKNPRGLEDFEKHHGYFMSGDLQGLDSSARAQKALSIDSTKLFALVNEDRFKPGAAAQKLGGFEWQWWLIVESDSVREYRTYLQQFDAHDAVAEAATAVVDAARDRWFEEKMDSKFKRSLGYQRSIA